MKGKMSFWLEGRREGKEDEEEEENTHTHIQTNLRSRSKRINVDSSYTFFLCCVSFENENYYKLRIIDLKIDRRLEEEKSMKNRRNLDR